MNNSSDTNMFKRPILIFSNYCAHSKNFIKQLLEVPELFETFIRVNIDVDKSTKSRPDLFYIIQDALNYKISEVPTIIVQEGEFVLSGEEAFKWLQFQSTDMPTLQEDIQMIPFNPNEMGGFSDGYAQYGNNNLYDASEQAFKFLDKTDETIQTPQESDSISPDDYKQFHFKRNNVNAIPTSHPKQVETFQNTHSTTKRMNTGKQNDMDKKLETLMAERESVVPPPISRVG